MTKAAILISFLFAACDVGVVGGTMNTGTTDGSSGSGSGSGDGSAAAACANRVQPPLLLTKHIHATGGTDNAGQACMQAGCHAQGGAGPQFQFAGTIYKTDGVTPNPGVQINLTASNGTALNPPIASDDGGNFYAYAGSLAQAFPAKTSASVCPAPDQVMTDALQANGGGDCNSCHKPTGGDAPVITIADQ